MMKVTIKAVGAEEVATQLAYLVSTDGNGTKYLKEKHARIVAQELKVPVFCNDGYFYGVILPDGTSVGTPSWWQQNADWIYRED